MVRKGKPRTSTPKSMGKTKSEEQNEDLPGKVKVENLMQKSNHGEGVEREAGKSITSKINLRGDKESEQEKITYTKDIMKTESGMKILDKATAELAGSFKCAFWPGCVGTVNMKGKMVRGGTVEEPVDHPKQGTFVYICDEHDESEIETEGEEEEQQLESLGSDTSDDGDLSGKGSSSNTIDDIDAAVVEKNADEEDQDMFAEDLMSQSLLSRGGPK